MSRTATRILLGALLLVLLAAPAAAHAEDIFPIVRCGLEGQPPCSPCDIWATFKRLIDLLVQGITIPIAAFVIVYAGIMMLLAAGNPGKFQSAKTLLTNAFIGIGIILSAWLITNFLIRSLARDNVATEWYKFSCPTELAAIKNIDTVEPPTGAAPAAPTPYVCNDSSLATAVGNIPAQYPDSPELTQLMNCLRADPIVAQMIDQRQIFRGEANPKNAYCNVSKGIPICGAKCSHSYQSCHYGGKDGRAAMAVDWNSNMTTVAYNYKTRTVYPGNKCPAPPTPAPSGPPPTPHPCRLVSGEEGLFDELYRAAKKRNCTYKLINFEVTDTGKHTHMSVPSCTSDKQGVGGRDAPVYP